MCLQRDAEIALRQARKEEKKKEREKRLKKLKEQKPDATEEEEKEEDEKEEELPSLYIPSPPSPLHCGFYSTPGSFWLSMVLYIHSQAYIIFQNSGINRE